MVNKLKSRRARAKLSFIVTLLLVPMIAIGYLTASQTQEDVRFAESEVIGVRFNKIVMPIMFKIAGGQSYDEELAVLDDQGVALANRLGIRGEYDGFTALLAKPDTHRLDLIRSVRHLLLQASEKSNLILDPSGETYHLAALSSVYVVDLISNVVEVDSALHGDIIQAVGDLIGVESPIFQLGRLSDSVNRLRRSAVSAASWSEQPKLYNGLVGTMTEMSDHPANFADEIMLRTPDTRAAKIMPPVLVREADAFRAELVNDSRSAWTLANAQLGDLLQARVNMLRWQLFLMLAGSCAAALLALATAAFMFGSSLSELDKVEAAYAQAEGARREAEEMSHKMQDINEDISKLNRELAENVERLREAQDEIVKKGKMAQLGQLVATVAHELRNPLGAVRTSAFLLDRKIKGKGLGVEPQLERISNGIVRCDSIITQLLDFARNRQIDAKPIALDDWLAKIVEDEAAKLPEQVTIECELGLEDLEVAIDPERMSRAVINLISNASEAMVGKGNDNRVVETLNPRIYIATRRTRRGVEISVRDNGPGMSDDVRARVLEPLFTTKNFGTGLGLPAVAKIAEQHGGGLDIDTALGAGACFTLWFPKKQTMKEAA